MTAVLNGKVKVDLDLNAAKAAAEAEANHTPFRFAYGPDDQTFTIPPMVDWPMSVEVRLADGQLSGALSVLLGEQMEAFMACEPTFGDLQLLLEQVGTWAGVAGLGNSAPPQRLASTQT
jgi:hypothetical protein